MPQWDGTKPISTDTLNSGNQYTIDSQLSVDALNAIIESGLFAQNFVKNLGVAVDSSVGTPTVTITKHSNDNYVTISFSNLKGEQGKQGIQGEQGIQGVGIKSITITES